MTIRHCPICTQPVNLQTDDLTTTIPYTKKFTLYCPNLQHSRLSLSRVHPPPATYSPEMTLESLLLDWDFLTKGASQ